MFGSEGTWSGVWAADNIHHFNTCNQLLCWLVPSDGLTSTEIGTNTPQTTEIKEHDDRIAEIITGHKLREQHADCRPKRNCSSAVSVRCAQTCLGQVGKTEKVKQRYVKTTSHVLSLLAEWVGSVALQKDHVTCLMCGGLCCGSALHKLRVSVRRPNPDSYKDT